MSQALVGLRVSEESFPKHIAVLTSDGTMKLNEKEYNLKAIRRVVLDLYGNTVIVQIVCRDKKKVSIKLDSICCIAEMHKLVDAYLFDENIDPLMESHGFCKVLGGLLSKAPRVQALRCSL